MSYSTLETHLTEVRSLIEDEETRYLNERTEHALPILTEIAKFITSKHLMLYGGTALNEMLPRNLKIYKPNSLPDFDCFSYKALEHAKELANYLKDRGYDFIEVRRGIHEGTYKVICEAQVFADITQIGKQLFEYLMRKTIVNPVKNQSNTMFILSPPIFLMWSFYKELSRPRGSGFRWEKLFSRYVTFSKLFSVSALNKHKQLYVASPPSKQLISDYKDTVYLDVREQMLDLIKTRKFALVGNFAIAMYLKMKRFTLLSHERFYAMDIMTEDIEATVDDLVSAVYIPEGYELKVVRKNTWKYVKHILDDRMHIQLINGNKKWNIVNLFQVEGNCYSIKTSKGFHLGSPDTVLQYLYAYLIAYEMCERANTELAMEYKRLIMTMETYISNLKRPKERLSISCVGMEVSRVDFQKLNWNNKQVVYRP